MMNEELDDNEFFQQDFTTASEWEIFNARLEEIFHEWKLSYGGALGSQEPLGRNQLSVCEWIVVKEKIKFADVELDVVWVKADVPEEDTAVKEEDSVDCQAFVDLMANGNDYCIVDQMGDGKLHPLAQWYGLREFVVVVPVKKSITNESQIRILMSSIHIAVSESSCDVPVFVQVLDKVQNVFLGVCESGSTRLSFDIVHLNVTPPTCKYLSGLLDVFKGKVGVPYMDPVAVSVRFSYSLSKFLSASYVVPKKVPFSNNGGEEHVDDKNIFLPFGLAIDPVSELVLHCTWPHVADNVVIDSQTYSDFDPLTAPAWSLRARYEDTPVCFMSDCIQEFLQISESRRAITEFFPELAFGATQNLEGTKALERLTESKIPTLASVLPGMASAGTKQDHIKLEGPLNNDLLKDMLYYLFPDAQKDALHEYQIPGQVEFDPLKIKSAHPDSLVHRLGTLMAVCNSYYGGKRAVAQLWAEFSQEMRYRVERCIQIPGPSVSLVSFFNGNACPGSPILIQVMAENCISYVPTTEEYFSEYSTALIILLVIAGCLLLLVSGLYYQIARIILDSYARLCQVELIIANGIYAVVVAFCIISLAVPVLSEQFNLATLIVFSWCIFALYRYIVLTAGGHDTLRQMYESGSNERLATGGLVRRLLYRIFGGYNFTRFSIVQFPVVSTILSVVQIVLHLVDIDEYYKHLYTFLVISIISILLYLIAFSLLVNLIEPKFPDSKIVKKFKYLRLVVLVIKIQIQILEAIFRGVDIQCNDFPGEAWSLLNLVKQPLIVVQMIVLAFATWTVYRKETKLNIASNAS